MISTGVFTNTIRKFLALVTGAGLLLSLVNCGGGGGGDTQKTLDQNTVTVTGVVHDGDGNSHVRNASCSFIDTDGDTQDTDICDQDGRFALSVPPEVQGYVYCGPRSMASLNLATFSSTVGYAAGQTIDNENITPTTTVVADIIRYEQPADPEARKAVLIRQAQHDPNLAIVTAIAGRLFRAMLSRQIDARFGDDRSRGDGAGDGGRGDDGGVSGDAGDGADFSPLPGARCAFVIGDDLENAEEIFPAALADFISDGALDRPDLAPMADLVLGGLGYSSDEIQRAFSAWFPQGLGEKLATFADGDGRYFLPVPANLAGYVRCTPSNLQKMALATYLSGRPAGADLTGQDVTPATTVFSVLIASQLKEGLGNTRKNYFDDIDGLKVMLEGPNLPAGPLTDITLDTETLPRNSDVGLVAFSATALFNALLKEDQDVDFPAAIDNLAENLTVVPGFLTSQGVPLSRAQTLANLVNPAIQSSGQALRTTLGAALSKARVNLTVRKAADDSPIAGAAVAIDHSVVTCDEGCDQRTDTQGRLTLTLIDVPRTATQVALSVSAEPDYAPAVITTTLAAFATVDVTARLSESSEDQGTISGAVIDAVDDAPLAGVQVTAYHGGQPVASTTTDNQGNYTLQCALGATYTLHFVIAGYLPTRYNNVTVSADSITFLETALQLSTSYSGEGDISGTIRNALNNDPIAGVNLQLREGINSVSGSIIASAITDAAGAYGFSDIPGGVYTASASHGNYHDLHFTVVSVGGQARDAQDAAMSPALASGEIRIVLSWGAEPPDLDSHLTGPASGGGTFHCYWYNRDPDPGYVNLDLDDRDGNGPETTTILQSLAGTYQFQVQDYSNRLSTTSAALSNSNARVTVYGDSGQIAAYNVPSGQAGTVWTVFDLDGASGRITPRNSMAFLTSSSARYLQELQVEK